MLDSQGRRRELVMNRCGFQLRDDKAGRMWLDFPSAYTVEDLDLVAYALGEYLEANAPSRFCILLDISQVEKTQTATRRRFAAFLSDHEELFKERCAAVAMVVGVLTGAHSQQELAGISDHVIADISGITGLLENED